jgi:hypothetical protein
VTSDALCNSATMMDSIWHDTPMKHMTDTVTIWHSNVYLQGSTIRAEQSRLGS